MALLSVLNSKLVIMATQTITSLKKSVWKIVSQYIRQRDADWRGNVKCCTCSTTKHWKEMHAGHYKHGNTKLSYFEEKNIHGQCNSCNTYKGGCLDLYAIFLEEKYGYGILQKLNKLADAKHNWNRTNLLEVKEKYKKKLNELLSTR